MKETVIKLMLAVLLSSNPPGAFAKQGAVQYEGKKAPETEEGFKLIKSIRPWSDARIKLMKRQDDLPGVSAMALSPNGNLLAWGDEENNVFLWFSQEDKLVVVKDTTVAKPPRGEPYAPVESIRFKKDDMLYWMNARNSIWLADIKGGKASIESCTSTRPARIGVIGEDSFILCTRIGKGLWDLIKSPQLYELLKYDLETGKYQDTCTIYPRGKKLYYHFIEVMALSQDNSLLAIASQVNSGLVRLKDFKLIQTFNIIAGSALAISPDNSHVALGCWWSDEILVFDAVTGKLVNKVNGVPDRHAMAFESDNILWFYYRPRLYRVDLTNNAIEIMWKSPKPTTVGQEMLIDRKNRRIYLGGMFDGTVKIFEMP